jgi:hypothetical protein
MDARCSDEGDERSEKEDANGTGVCTSCYSQRASKTSRTWIRDRISTQLGKGNVSPEYPAYLAT